MRITNERAHSATLILVGALPSLLALFVVLHREGGGRGVLQGGGGTGGTAQLRPSDSSTTAPGSHCSGFRDAYTDGFRSEVTRGMDWRFYCETRRFGSDKFDVDTHQYQYIYSKYLDHLQGKPVRLLEIGLGCNMGDEYGAGRSFKAWKHYFPQGQISFLDNNRSCMEGWRERIEATGGHVYIGAQADESLLEKVVADRAQHGLYDIIVDDGMHDPTMQMQTLTGLWPALESGGIYIMEDVMLAYFRHYEKHQNTFLQWLPRAMDMVHCHSAVLQHFNAANRARCATANEVERGLYSIECMVEACVLVKR